MDKKDTNPKDAVGTAKVPFSTLSARVLGDVALGMLEGARKYGRHNYRVAGVRAAIYYDASLRHLYDWWEGQDIDPKSGLNHVTKAIAGLMVLRDSMLRGNWIDDRPPACAPGWVDDLNEQAKRIIEMYPDAVPPYTQKEHGAAEKTPVQAPRESFDANGSPVPVQGCSARLGLNRCLAGPEGHAGEHVAWLEDEDGRFVWMVGRTHDGK